jgi:hypothetical protein
MAEDTGNGAGGAGEGGSGGTEGSATVESLSASFKALQAENETLKTNLKAATAEAVTRKAKIKEMEAAQESARKKKADGSNNVDEVKAQYENIFKGLKETNAKLTNDIREIKVFGNVRSIANKLNVINPDDVVTLIRGKITFDENGETVIDGGRINKATAKPYSLDEFTTEFLSERQHLIRSSGNTGAGSTGGSGGGSATQFTPEQIDNMSSAEYEKNRDAILKSVASGK